MPTERVSGIVKTVKSLTAREIFKRHEEVKEELWGGKFWSSGYYANTAGKYGNEEVIRNYVKNQGRNYKEVYRVKSLFDCT